MIRHIAGATGQSSHTVRTMNRRRFKVTPSSLTDDASDDIDNLAQLVVEGR